MAKKSDVDEKSTPSQPAGFYKGYDINWLRSVQDQHPDGNLVDEYDKLNKEVNYYG